MGSIDGFHVFLACLSGLFTTLSTAAAWFAWRCSKDCYDEVTRVRSSRNLISLNEGAIENLHEQLRKLRGLVYKARSMSTEPQAPAEPPPPETREETLLRLRNQHGLPTMRIPTNGQAAE